MTVALHTRDCQNLAGPHIDRQRIDSKLPAIVAHRDVREAEHHFTRSLLRALNRQVYLTANHHAGQLGCGGTRFCFAHNLAQANHNNSVGYRFHLTKLVGDEDDRSTRRSQLLHDRHEFIGLLRGKHRGWLVEHQSLGVAAKCFDDLHALLHTNGKVAHQRIRVYVEAELVTDFFDSCSRLRKINLPGELGWFMTEGHVFGDGEHWDEHKVLVNHADSGCHGITRTLEVGLLVIDENLTGVGLIEAV